MSSCTEIEPSIVSNVVSMMSFTRTSLSISFTRTSRYPRVAALWINHPMKAIQRPLKKNPFRIWKMPRTIKTKATACPVTEAILVARFRFPVIFQMMARNTLPPSRGKPGIILNSASSMLITARYCARAAMGTLAPFTVIQIPRKMKAIIRLERGPTSAMMNSLPAVSGS